MDAQVKQYETNLDSQFCQCGEAVLISEMVEKQFPCTHLHYLGMDFPNVDPPLVELTNVTQGELIIEYDYLASKKIETNIDYYSKLQEYVIKTIKRYSHNNEKEEIKKFVLERLSFTSPPEQICHGISS